MTDPVSGRYSVDENPPGPTAQDTAALTYLLRGTVEAVQADIGIIYRHYAHENRCIPQAIYTPHDTPDDTSVATFHTALESILGGLLPSSPAAAYPVPHDVFPVALVCPLTQSNQTIIGILVVAGRESSDLNEARLPLLQPPAQLAETWLLQQITSRYLRRVRAAKKTLELLHDTTSPQQAIEVICNREERLEFALGAILTYGPASLLDAPQGPFDYLEVEGVWPHPDFGAPEPNTRIKLNKITEAIQTELSGGRVVALSRAQAEHDLSPLIAALAIPITQWTMTLFPLATQSHRMGILLLVTDASQQFQQGDFDRYETMSRFYSNVLLNYIVLEQQTFLVQGRAILLDAVTDGLLIQVLYHGTPYVMMFNQSFANMFGVDVDQLLPIQTLLEKMQISHKVQQELYRAWVMNDIQSPQIHHGQFNMTSLKGAPATINWHSIPFYQDGLVVGRLLTFHDISPEYTAHALRKELVSRVSHELRTPLTSISGFAELILDMYGSDLPEPAQEYATHILTSARYLRDVVSDIIHITRADTGLLSLSMVHVQISEILKNIAATMDMYCQPNGISIHLQIQPNLPFVLVDVERMTQVLSHLTLNAVQYSPENGNIIITARLVEDYAGLPKSAPKAVIVPCVLVGIHDEGQGVLEDDVENVFLPFYRTQVARRERIQGAGLGLAVARSFIEIHRGRIWAEVHPGKHPGGHFLFTLPVTLG